MLWCLAAKTIILLTSGRSVFSNTCTPNVWFLLAWLYILYEKMTSLPGEESEICNIYLTVNNFHAPEIEIYMDGR